RGLERLIAGRRITALDVWEPKSFQLDPGADVARDLLGAAPTAARRRGKALMIDLDSDASLVAHLKMTGQMVVRGAPDDAGTGDWGAGHPTDSLLGQLPDNSSRLAIGFADGARLFFNDQRKFGWVRLMPTARVPELPFLARLGPEPFEGDPWPEFHRRARRHQATTVKAALLNQEVIAGIGNIYADESLWAARVHPAKRVADVTDRKLRAILDAALAVMELSISLGGSTDRNYVDARGRRGAYLDFAKVFRRQGQPCERCGHAIAKIRVAGRGTHVCPRCQRL
ncbi:MAG: bifunctional DNA-formamidopyrimidine glycosylase/DNA-(apurinic or apyrimidinic site) lyase, partial [Bifidobacteriaceae bacterium]|nr:bifunctional DNA-formamidopyrimidine glycosylase/DNA-(apurinic or apyrimidinic site) lyase [Bifidobacteriaceae bacterium]